MRALANVDGELRSAPLGRNAEDQSDIDRIMTQLYGTLNKARLGANAILAISLAVAKAAAQEAKLPLY